MFQPINQLGPPMLPTLLLTNYKLLALLVTKNVTHIYFYQFETERISYILVFDTVILGMIMVKQKDIISVCIKNLYFNV